jgi:hypothetical protein
MINPLVILFPPLFGCRRVSLTGIVGEPGVEQVLAALKRMDAVKVGETCTPADELGNYYFKVGGKWVVLVVEEYTAMKLIAPQSVNERVQHELGFQSRDQ